MFKMMIVWTLTGVPILVFDLFMIVIKSKSLGMATEEYEQWRNLFIDALTDDIPGDETTLISWLWLLLFVICWPLTLIRFELSARRTWKTFQK